MDEQIYTLLQSKEYAEFLVGRDGAFDQLVSSTIRRCKREYLGGNSSHVLLLPYETAEYRNNEKSFQEYYDESHLCQNCLDSINSMCFTTQSPAEFAIVNFEERTIQPLLNAHPWFSSGKYGVDCEFKQNGKIDLLIHYAVNPYLTEK